MYNTDNYDYFCELFLKYTSGTGYSPDYLALVTTQFAAAMLRLKGAALQPAPPPTSEQSPKKQRGLKKVVKQEEKKSE